MEKDIIIKIVYEAIDGINVFRDNEDKIVKTVDTLLFSENSGIDSLGIVNLIVALEDSFENITNKSLNLVEELKVSQNYKHFYNVNSLVDFLMDKVK